LPRTYINLSLSIKELCSALPKSKSGYVKSSLKDIEDKLQKFFKKHNYSNEEIIEATKRYVKRKEAEGYAYMQKAVFFIEKDKISNLASEIEELRGEIKDSPINFKFEDRL
jgi:hypothetical protein